MIKISLCFVLTSSRDNEGASLTSRIESITQTEEFSLKRRLRSSDFKSPLFSSSNHGGLFINFLILPAH